MKILLVNKFLFPRGGDCVYTLGLGKLLSEHGHRVTYFGIDASENVAPKGCTVGVRGVDFSSPRLADKVRAAHRIFGGDGVKKRFAEALRLFAPDVVHLNNIHSYLSPVLARMAHRRGIRVVWTLHDYKLICPSYTLLCRGEVCSRCLSGRYHVLSRRCMKNSLPASLLAMLEAGYWCRNRLAEWTDVFVCPSRFMAEQMSAGGFPANKLQVLPNFLDRDKEQLIIHSGIGEKREKAYAYVGRLSSEKGVEELLKCAGKLPHKLYIAGDGSMRKSLEDRYASDKIVFLGKLSAADAVALLGRVSFSVVPSVWYENSPLGIIESLCCGTPVLGRKMGGIPELIRTDAEGMLFSADGELAEAIESMFDRGDRTDNERLRECSLHRFSADSYLKELFTLYNR